MKEQTAEQQQQMESQVRDSQAQEPAYLQITDSDGISYTLVPTLGLYSTEDFMGREMPGLAIDLDIYVGPDRPPVPYTRLTVNFGEFISIPNSAYVDINDYPFPIADQLLAQGIAEQTAFTKTSGHCTYPLWTFKKDFLKKIGAEEYQEYVRAYKQYYTWPRSENEGPDMPEQETDQSPSGPEQEMTMGGMSL